MGTVNFKEKFEAISNNNSIAQLNNVASAQLVYYLTPLTDK